MFGFIETRICQNHMEANMDPSNCVGLYHWARNMGAAGLADCALRYMCQHFAEVSNKYEELLLRTTHGYFWSQDKVFEMVNNVLLYNYLCKNKLSRMKRKN